MLIFIERVALRLMDFQAQAYPDGAVAKSSHICSSTFLFLRRAIRGVPNITFFGSSEAGSCRKCDFCVRQTDLLKFCCSRKVISGCFRFKQCFPESSVSKSTAITGMQFSVIQFFQHLYHFKYWIVFVNHCCNVYRHDYLIFARFHCIISSLSVGF